MGNCPTCGNATSENASLCPSCGEPLADGWATRKTQTELARKQKKSNGRKKYYFAVIAGIFIATLLIPSEEEKLEKLKIENPSQYQALVEQRRVAKQEQISNLENEAAATPEGNLEDKINTYNQLIKLDPENETYKNGVEEYKRKERVRDEKIAIFTKQAQEMKEREKRRKGFHCLSGWDGSHRGVKDYTKKNMREPDSFEHIETRITPVDDNGRHTLSMTYRARNGFGGMNVAVAVATIRNADCSATITALN